MPRTFVYQIGGSGTALSQTDQDNNIHCIYDELKGKGQEANFDDILENVKQRDYIDQHREVSPLRKADDALLLDNSHMTIAEQKRWLTEQCNKITAEQG